MLLQLNILYISFIKFTNGMLRHCGLGIYVNKYAAIKVCTQCKYVFSKRIDVKNSNAATTKKLESPVIKYKSPINKHKNNFKIFYCQI